jgi:hypothetical protein
MSSIQRFRPGRPSVPIEADLYASTDNPVVVAFQLAAGFYDENRDPPLTLEGLRKRWQVGLPAARTARRALIDLGWWVEVNTFTTEDEQGRRYRRPQRCTVTRTHEKRLTEDDLRDLAAEYPAGSRLDCGGVQYVVTADGQLERPGQTDSENAAGRSDQDERDRTAGATDRQKTAPRSNGSRGAENSRSVRPADSPTGVQKTHGRSDQGKRVESAPSTDREKTAPNASSSLRDDDLTHACMDEFWALMAQTARIDPPGRRAVHHQVGMALQTGWTPTSLAAWATARLTSARERRTIGNPGGFLVSQLKEIPVAAEARDPGNTPGRRAVLPACTVCGAMEGTPRAQRTVEDPDSGLVRRCGCVHPNPDATDRDSKPGRPQPASGPTGREDTDSVGDGPVQPDDPLAMAGLAS